MDERKAFLLRISPQLWKELEAWSQDELRSVNGQIEFVLKQAVQRRKSQRPAPENSPPAGPATEPH
ncbi:MAG: Arc family DNA binding domain-containing protein [Verrucomicrobiota bacterium]